jgi:hypothetical protein
MVNKYYEELILNTVMVNKYYEELILNIILPF